MGLLVRDMSVQTKKSFIESNSEYDTEDYHQDAQNELNSNSNPEENKSSLVDPSSNVYSASESEYKSPGVVIDLIKVVSSLDDSKFTLQ